MSNKMDRGKFISLAPFLPAHRDEMSLCILKWDKNTFHNYCHWWKCSYVVTWSAVDSKW